MPTVRIMLTSTMAASGNFARFPKLQENEGQMLVPNSPISLIHLIHEADLKY